MRIVDSFGHLLFSMCMLGMACVLGGSVAMREGGCFSFQTLTVSITYCYSELNGLKESIVCDFPKSYEVYGYFFADFS